jgi:hypothetical protein
VLTEPCEVERSLRIETSLESRVGREIGEEPLQV